MRILQTSEFDDVNVPKVQPPANRARPHDTTTMNLALARVNAARPRKPTAGELVDPPAPCRTTARQLRAATELQLHLALERAWARVRCNTTATSEFWNLSCAWKNNRPPMVRGTINSQPPQNHGPRTRRGNLALCNDSDGLPKDCFT